jgi:hypothetical protein
MLAKQILVIFIAFLALISNKCTAIAQSLVGAY